MTAKEDLVEPNHGQQPTTTMDTIDQHDIDILDQQQQSPPPDYQSSILNENDDKELDDDDTNLLDENGEPLFPNEDFVKLEEQLARVHWIVPVLPDGELIKCLRAAVRLARNKLDTKSESCQKFIRDSLVNSFTKIFCDDAVQTWKPNIYDNIYKNTMIFINLCVLKLDDDCSSLLEILSFVVNPFGRFHQANQNSRSAYHLRNASEPFATLAEYRLPSKGWLLDFINKFGDLNGFDKLLARFLSSETKLTISLVVALLKPWGLCYDYLTQATIKKYFAPIIEFVPQFLDQLTENDFKSESKGESKSDTLSGVIKWLRHLASRLPENDHACRTLDALRLKIILRLLQTNSFSGKMNALNEVNKLLPNLNPIHRSTMNRNDDNEGLTAEKFIEWIREHEILDIVLRDCLHQPQYVEKLEKPLRFIIKAQALTRNDLAKIWNVSYGKHEAIEKNIHDLLAKLAWDFSPEQLEQLFDCFRESWTKSNNKQREKLLELIRRLAEDDKEGLMANKVLELLWTLSHDKDLPNEIVDQALAAHLKILDCNCLLEKDKTKLTWIDIILDEVKRDEHVILALRQMREICTQFPEHSYMHNMNRISGSSSRAQVIHVLESKNNILRILTENLCQYMDKLRQTREKNKKILPPEEVYPDNRFNHNQQIHERLVFLKFILKDGHYYLHSDHLKMIWSTLAEQAVYPQDREQCFRWFADIIDEVGFDPKTAKDFFQNQILKLEPHLLTNLGMNCFDRFFKSVNAQSNKFQQKRRSIRLINDEDLLGIEYLWKLITNGSDEVSDRGTQIIKEVYTNISPQLKQDIKRIHETFLYECFQRLKQIYDSIKSKPTTQKFNSLTRILIVLREYLFECDYSYHRERQILPMSRANRGRNVLLNIRVNTGQNRQNEEFDYQCHSNETWGHIRRMIFNRYKSIFGIMELYRNIDLVHPADDNKTLAQTDQRDRITVIVRWVQLPNQACSSGESSSSDSEINHNMSSAHQNRLLESIDPIAENALPSVIFSQKHEYYQFLFDISDLGCQENNIRLRDISRQILELVPVDQQIKNDFTNCFQSITKHQSDDEYHRWQTFYLISSPTQMLYHLKVTSIRLSPIFINQETANLDGLHVFFLNTGGLICLLNILTEKNLTEHCDISTKKSIYFVIFSILKRFLAMLGFYQLKPGVSNDSLEQSLASMSLSPTYTEQHSTISFEKYLALILQKHDQEYPIPKKSFIKYEHIIEFIRLIWCLASNNRQISFELNIKQDFSQIHKTFKQDNIDTYENNEYDISDEGSLACREGLELLCLSLALVPTSVENLMKENFFEYFLFDLLLYCLYPNIRQTASEQIYILTTRCSQGQTEHLLKYLIDKQFQMFNKYSNDLKQYSSQSLEFFLLLCRLLSFASNTQIHLLDLDQQLDDEIRCLKNIQLPIDDHLLYGHLSLAKELVQFQSSERKRFYGIDQLLIQQLIEQYLFPASTLLYQYRTYKQDNIDIELKEPPVPICQFPMTTSPAFDLLVSLGTNCLDNLKLIDKYITDLFYSAPDSNLNEWDYSLPFGQRSNRGFVGLKNASATCYMNSVLQQLFMIQPLRTALLSVKIPSEYCQDEIDDDDIRRDNFDSLTDAKAFLKDNNQNTVSAPKDRNEYNIQILRQMQRIFGHLLDSKLQFYIPKEFWKIFKFAGEPVNLRDQQDAVEFLNTLVDNLDEALKALNLPQICSLVLGGQFADQKICKDCPHRYTREEDFTLLSVDIRHSQNLQSSLELYVQGELLDGPNAYFCEKCNKKVDTIKRTCFKKLPTILAIQLKRFDYDWERETPIKFNDYFEFPRELDMEPYTVQGLAKAEGTPLIDENLTNDGTRYKLVGIIVHKGQANGGHYYSFIQYKDNNDNLSHWYLFDDTDVSECRMDDDEELRSNCFGGENSGSSFDQPAMKRKCRWWNAYILFYEKIPTDQSTVENKLAQLKLYDDQTQRMPLSVQRSVRKQNIKFLHNRILFSPECFNFIKKLVQSNVQYLLSLHQQSNEKNVQTIEEIALICIQIAAKFLFSFGWRAKKMLRGPATEWTENINACLRLSSKARAYLAEEVLFKHSNRFQEYLIDCTAADVRASFSRILYHLAIYSRPDDPTNDKINIEETILYNVLRLLKKDIPENVKMLTQYFIFFTLYTQAGRQKCENLIRFRAPAMFVNLSIDDLSSSTMRLNEPTKLSIILSILLRCFDTTALCKSNNPEQNVLPNPNGTYDTPICPMPQDIIEIIYRRENFLKKVLEDATSCDESARLLRFLLWENPDLTTIIFNEIVGLLSIYYTNDLRAHLELVRMVLTIEDSWQEARILYALKGIPIMPEPSSPTTTTIMNNNNINNNNHQSLFDIFSKSKSSYQKRAYQCLKVLQILFTNCEKANQILQTDPEIKRQWVEAVHWLRDQLERPTSIPSNYTYYQSTGQIHSNDSLQGYQLERTASARSVLEKAVDLCSDREIDDADYNSDEIDDDEPVHHSQP